MAKRGPKPKIVETRGRKKGTKVHQKQNWNSERENDDKIIPQDHSRFHELAMAYIKEYKLSVSHAARLAVQIEFLNLKYAIEVFYPISLKLPRGPSKTFPLAQSGYNEKLENLIDNVSVSDSLRKLGWNPKNEKNVDLIQTLPAPTKPWINANDPTVRRVAARIYRERRNKSDR